MKKFLSVILIAVTLISLCSCSIIPKTTDNPNIITVTDEEGNVSRVEYIPDPTAQTVDEINAALHAEAIPVEEMKEVLRDSAEVLEPYKLTIEEVANQIWERHDDSDDAAYVTMFLSNDNVLYYMWYDDELHVNIMNSEGE